MEIKANLYKQQALNNLNSMKSTLMHRWSFQFIVNNNTEEDEEEYDEEKEESYQSIMELSHNLTLNEEAYNQIPEQKRPVFVFEWLRFLDKVLIQAQKTDIKECQKKLVEQLTTHMQNSPGPPTRKLIARCLALLFSVGDTFLLFETVNKCNDILRNKDDSPSFLSTKLAAINVVGAMYEQLGRMMGRSYEETVQILLKSLRNAESQMRIEIIVTLEKICAGMGKAISNVHKEIYKSVRVCLSDRVMSVRVAASNCLLEMLNHAPFLYTTELESMSSQCFRAFEGSNYEVRVAVAKLLGNLIAQTQLSQQTNGKSNTNSLPSSAANSKTRPTSLDEALGFLMSGFLRGGGSFLKGTGEMIKGSSGLNREVRVGVTHAYVIFAHTMGSVWLERNLQTFLIHVLDLVANPKAASSHVDAVYSRKCINFILRSVVGKMIGEKAQSSTCKELIHIIAKQMNSIDFNPENAKDANQETLFSQHLLVCALQELGSLTIGLGTTAQNLLSDQSLNFIDAVCAVLVHPCSAARLAAAWCLRCVCVAVPSQITPLIDRCLDAIEKMRSSPDAISGYSGALAAVVGSVRYSPLGIPHTKGKIIFNTAEELLRTASQNSRLSLNRTQSGWLLIGAIMTLGVPVVKGLLPRMLLLWRNAFPRSSKELESEKARGDAFTWQVTLEGRAGALSVMHSFLTHCGELVTDDITRRLLIPIESALAMLINITQILKNYGQHLKAPAAMVRLRLYETLTLLPSTALESSYTHLLRMLVSEFTLTENQANTTTSLLRDMCNAEDSIILGTWLEETDHRYVEDQLQPISASGSGALEHDPCCLYRPLQKNETSPGPLPLGVSVIDMSAMLFGNVFSYVSNKHRLQMLEHFSECIKHAKSQRQEAVQMNIFTALLCGLKGLTESKCSIGQDDVKKSATNLIINGLISPNPILRCAAGETLGRIAQVVGDSRFTAELAQTSFDRLKSARDVVTRTGHSLALGCLHRCVGGMGSSQHLNTSVSILLALAQDSSSPVVQVWSLYALAMIADSGGPMFRGYIEPALSMGLKLLLTVPQSNVDVHQCVGRVLSALITTIGPELQGNETSICSIRSNILCACAIMQAHSDPLVQAEAVGCLQQLHLFAPKFVNLSSLVPTLCRTLSSNYLILRKAAISCLRQLTTREAREVTEHALSIFTDDDGLLSEYGLMGMLFAMLDTETDQEMIKNIHDTIVSMLQMLAADNLSHWLSMCKRVLTVASESDNGGNEAQTVDNDGEDEDDNAEFHAEEPTQTHPAVQPRWKTRVFAAECVRKIIVSCEQGSPKHFDLIAAKDLNSRGDFLVLHLSDLIRMSFMAATSDSDQLRLEGLKTLQEIVDKFARVPEPEFPGHLLLEQFQAQVSAALRPAFASETPSHVTAAACEVCSAWIGSGVARDLNDLRRVHQLLVQSLAKLQSKTNSTLLYNESMATLEKLSILKAWAQVYIIAMISNGSSPTQKCLKKLKSVQNSFSAPSDDEMFEEYEPRGESLLSLVQPELENLSRHWLAALRDYALLSLPSEYSSQLPHDGGAFFTTDTINSSKPHYQSSWPQILIASSLWLNSGGFESGLNVPTTDHTETRTQTITHGSLSADRFYLIFGICMESLCSTRSNEKLDCVIACLTALYTIFDSKWARETMAQTKELLIELSNVLYRQILTRDSLEVQLLSVEIMKQSIAIARDSLNVENDPNGNDVDNNEENVIKKPADSEDLSDPTKSHVYAILEVIVCLLARHCPELNPSQTTRLTFEKPTNLSTNGNYRLNDDNNMIVGLTLNSMEDLPSLCTHEGAVKILPTILYLTTGVIQEMATKSCHDNAVLANCGAIQAALHLLKAMTVHKYASDEKSADDWRKYLESALAKIIDLTKTGSNDEKKLDEVTMMLAIAVFILHAPKVVMMPTFQYPSINLFRQCFQSDSTIVRLKCIQTAKSIFLNADLKVATPYIHSLAPRIIEHLFDDNTKCPKDEIELTLIQESITTVDCLITLAEPQNRIQMLTLLVPILIRFLLEPSQMKNSSKFSIQLHDHALMWLMKIGPKYPQEFKSLMSQAPELKMKLETTVRNQQQAADLQKTATETSNETSKTIVQPQQPTIKLKTKFDF